MNLYTEPVVGDNFFAREDTLNSLIKSATDIKLGYRHNIAIIGRGLIGKSSLLLHFLGIVKDDEKLIPVYISLKGTSFVEFADNFITMLLYHSLKRRKKLKREHDIDYLRNCARDLFPKSCDLIKKIKALIEEKDFDEAYSSLWDLNVVLASESGGFPVIVLDEFNLISSFQLKKPFQILGQKIMVQQRTFFILSSSSTVTAKKILTEKLSLLFGGFKIMDIGPFTPQQARVFINRQCKGINISDDLKDFLLILTGGHPFYLSSIIQKLQFTKRYGTDKISPRHLSQIIAELLFYPSGIINQFFSNLLRQVHTDASNRDIYDILKMILLTGRASDIINRSTISSAQLLSLLNRFLEVGIVSKNGSLHAITDAAFRMWIEIKSRPRNLCFDFIPQDEDADYAKEIEERMAHFKAERKRGFDERIVELVSSFKNDQFFIDERVRVLPHLSYVRQQKLSPDNILLVMRGKKRWLFVVSNIRVTEEEVYSMLMKIKSLKYDSTKIILIATLDIDDAAKLLAKQKRIWIWNRDDVNRLFLFYKGYNALIA